MTAHGRSSEKGNAMENSSEVGMAVNERVEVVNIRTATDTTSECWTFISGRPLRFGARGGLVSRYVSERLGFAIDYPSGWMARIGEAGVWLEESTDSKLRFSDSIVVYTEAGIEDERVFMPGPGLREYQEASRRVVRLDGCPAERREYRHTLLGRQLKAIAYRVKCAERVYVLTANSEDDVEALDVILESFRTSLGCLVGYAIQHRKSAHDLFGPAEEWDGMASPRTMPKRPCERPETIPRKVARAARVLLAVPRLDVNEAAE